MRSKKRKYTKAERIATAMLAVAGVAILTGCAPAAQNEQQVGNGYTTEEVTLPSGKTVTCLWYDKDYKSGAMSCDWDNAR